MLDAIATLILAAMMLVPALNVLVGLVAGAPPSAYREDWLAGAWGR